MFFRCVKASRYSLFTRSVSAATSAFMAARVVSQKQPVLSLGPDGQALRKNIILKPGEWSKSDPFLLMAEDWFSQESGGFPDHPHRGFETVTLVLGGKLEHSDSKGNRGILGPGDVQWMTAAGGIIHSEIAHANYTVHCLQLWLNLPAKHKMDRTHYQDLLKDKIPVLSKGDVSVRVISGNHAGLHGPAVNVVPVLALDVEMSRKDSVFTTEIPSAYNGFIYVLEGDVSIGANKMKVKGGEVAFLPPAEKSPADNTDTLEVVAASDRAHFVLFAGQPIKEPVVARGPFVMDSQQRLTEAFRDYQSGQFIH